MLSLPGLVILLGAIALKELEPGGKGPNGAPIADYRARAAPVDRPAPAFTLPRLRGRGSVSLADFPDRIIVLNFWASWCPPCREEAPVLQRVWRDYRARGVQFLGIDHRDSRNDGLAFQRQFGITYPSVFDPQGREATAYGLPGIPATFVIAPGQQERYEFIGRVDGPVLRDILNGLLGDGGLGPSPR